MGLGILGDTTTPSTAAQLNAKYPWHTFSSATLDLQKATNQSLQAAGYCPVPSSGMLDGSLCGARNHLTIHSREFFGQDMLFSNPPACSDPANAGELRMPTPGCFTPSKLPSAPAAAAGGSTQREMIIIGGGVASVLLIMVLALRSK